MVQKFPDYWAREESPSDIESKRRAAWAPVWSQGDR